MDELKYGYVGCKNNSLRDKEHNGIHFNLGFCKSSHK